MSSPQEAPPRVLSRAATLSPLPVIAELADASANIAGGLPRNKSTGNLLAKIDKIDAESLSRLSDGAVVSDHSGLQRIRQSQPGSARPGMPARAFSLFGNFPSEPSRRTLGSAVGSEDLSRFPSESLHSFSFSRQASELESTRRHTARRTFDRLQSQKESSPLSPSDPPDSFFRRFRTGDGRKSSSIGSTSSPSLSDALSPATVHSQTSLSPVILADSRKQSLDSSSYPEPQSRQSFDRPLALLASRSFSHANLGSLPLPLPHTLTTDPATGVNSFSLAQPAKNPLANGYNRHIFSLHHPTDDASLPLKLKPTQSFPNLPSLSSSLLAGGALPHGNGPRGLPSRQAILTTEAAEPWTIHSANDQASLLFGITEAGVRKVGALEIIQPHRHAWLKSVLRDSSSTSTPSPSGDSPEKLISKTDDSLSGEESCTGEAPVSPSGPGGKPSVFGTGITARLLSKPAPGVARKLKKLEHQKAKEASSSQSNKSAGPSGISNGKSSRRKAGSRGVLVCGDVVPTLKANGEVGSATLWIKEKHGALIWVLEEIVEHVAMVSVDDVGCVVHTWGAVKPIWDLDRMRAGIDARKLIPSLPKEPRTSTGALDWEEIQDRRFFAARTGDDLSVPVTVEVLDSDMASTMVTSSPGLFGRKRVDAESDERLLRVSSFPYIAGVVILDSESLTVLSSNTAFSGALLGRSSLAGLHVNELIPQFDKLLDVIYEEMDGELIEGVSIHAHNFRSAKASLSSETENEDSDPNSILFGLPSIEALHRDGTEIMVDIQMRVVKNERGKAAFSGFENALSSPVEPEDQREGSKLVYALWISYSREGHVNVAKKRKQLSSKSKSSNGQSKPRIDEKVSDEEGSPKFPSLLSSPREDVERVGETNGLFRTTRASSISSETKSGFRHGKKSIDTFSVVEEMGNGAYGQVKLYREHETGRQVIIKHVTKKHILMDTWTRDRRLGTVPSEIHILDFLNRDGMRHPNIVEMLDFFEDDLNYYIEMAPHGVPGIDLFDYIEMQDNMTEEECRRMFVQVARAVDHLHNKAEVVHRDIKDENVILDGAGVIKLIDFGSAAYVKSGPFDMFVGTIDYAAPEVLEGRPYNGKEQDVWALGILLYTIIYKENPFYSVDEIMDHDLRVPYILSESSIDLIRRMLDRDITRRATIQDVLGHRWFQDE